MRKRKIALVPGPRRLQPRKRTSTLDQTRSLLIQKYKSQTNRVEEGQALDTLTTFWLNASNIPRELPVIVVKSDLQES